ncbi:MAG: SMC-Scp complex subunit ScpB, partial [Candidatus Kapaibacteriota bacterium]
RAETAGRPLLYGTTSEFLRIFGLAALEDLPRMKEIEELIALQPQNLAAELGSAVIEEEEIPALPESMDISKDSDDQSEIEDIAVEEEHEQSIDAADESNINE